jgi:hypothetical protein
MSHRRQRTNNGAEPSIREHSSATQDHKASVESQQTEPSSLSSGMTEPRSQRNCEDINNIIQRHHRKKMGINTARAEHHSRDQEDATEKTE